MTRTAWIATMFLLACGPAQHPAPTPAPKPAPATGSAAPRSPLADDLPALAKSGLAMYQDLAAAFAKAGPDCKAATTALAALADKYRDTIAANAQVLHDHRAKDLRAALAPYQADLDTAGQAVMTSKTLEACSSDGSFESAFDRLVAPP